MTFNGTRRLIVRSMKKVNGVDRSLSKFAHGRSLTTGYGLRMSEGVSGSTESANVKFWGWVLSTDKINPACEKLGVWDFKKQPMENYVDREKCGCRVSVSKKMKKWKRIQKIKRKVHFDGLKFYVLGPPRHTVAPESAYTSAASSGSRLNYKLLRNNNSFSDSVFRTELVKTRTFQQYQFRYEKRILTSKLFLTWRQDSFQASDYQK